MDSLNQLVTEQRSTNTALEKLKIKVQNLPLEQLSRGYAKVLIEKVDSLYSSFSSNHLQITQSISQLALNEADISYCNEDLYTVFEENYFSLKAFIYDVSPSSSNFPPTTFHSTFNPLLYAHDTTSSDAKLPKISLPSFSGDYLEWFAFRDLYNSLVHENSALSKIQKMYYLKSSVKGEAEHLIKHIFATEANYDLAWKTLEDRYHNKRMIVDTLLRKLCAIPKCSTASHYAIKSLLDTTKECLASLANLDVMTNNWDPMIIHLTAQKLDAETRKDWEHTLKATKELPKLAQLFNFLETTFRTLETLCENDTVQKYKPQTVHQRPYVKNFNLNKAHNTQACPCCKKSHFLFKCWAFRSYSALERKAFVEHNSLCINCLFDGHTLNDCNSSHTCHLCTQKHHTLLHGAFSSNHSNNDAAPQNNNTLQNHHVNKAPPPHTTSHILLATVLLKIETPEGMISARALLDQGSQGSFITEHMIQNYRIPFRSTHVQIHGVNSQQLNYVKKITSLQLRSRIESSFSLAVEALVLPKLSTNLPQSSVCYSNLPFSASITLADPHYYKSRPIDMILGADVYGFILKENQQKTDAGLLYQDTHFGWILSGPMMRSENTSIICTHLCHIDDELKRFWEQEEVDNKRIVSSEDLACEKHFVDTHKRLNSGRYCVALPFKSDLNGTQRPQFNNTHLAAMIRLRNMEKTFQTKPTFYEDYCKFMNEYEKLGHMQVEGIYPNDVKSDSYFLPHHGVEKLNSSTTKLRVVFDGSSKYRNHRSLNEELAAGPALQCDLSQLVLRWRTHKIAMCSDIEKMFRQIVVQNDHQRYQNILWRKSPNDPVKIYKLTTVTYGTVPAPFLSIRALQQLAKDECKNYSAASERLLRDIYVDDLITGADEVEEAVFLQKQLCKLLSAGGFSLRKWSSNSNDLLQSIPNELKELSNPIKLSKENYILTLGLQWSPVIDCFSFEVTFDTSTVPTKRSLLSDASKLFDPQGWFAPTTIIAKILFQKLWLVGIDWDDNLPDNICSEWLEYRKTLKSLENVKISRFIGTTKLIKCSLHGFCDASQVGFAAVIYSRTILENGAILIRILQAKTKVAPLKTISIHKLELCGAHLLAKLMYKVVETLQGCVEHAFLWCDSTTVLAWIRAQPNKWNVYVANRVSEIQRLTTISQWRYVPSHDNPADCASRGVMPSELPNHPLWWKGPAWLVSTPESWPEDIDPHLTTIKEQRKSLQVAHMSIESYPEILLKFSSLQKTIAVTAYIFRFFYNSKHNANRRCGHLSPMERQLSLQRLIALSQKIDFHLEIKQLSIGSIRKESPIAKLHPFLDKDGCLRVNGRLELAKIPTTMKHQIILSKKNPLTYLIFSDAHLVTLHGGITLMLNFIRRKYWVSNGRSVAQDVLRRCVTCFKYTAKAAQQLMGNLPSVRVTPARPFLHSGVDYAGPIDVRQSSLRNAKISKGYICVFLCLVTKAIHLEAVSSLTTEAFLAAFRRFVSRRGKCTQIYSDCGTNFIGASNALKLMHQRNSSSIPEDLRAILASEGTTWNFIPPASPHFGGLWEAGVKSTKFHLKRITNDRALNYEELSTVLAQIEACLNSRPLCPLNEDVENCDALTPAHFLIGEPTINIPDEELLAFATPGISRWRMVEHIKQHFWRRWFSEYLSRLQCRPKWATVHLNAKVGDLVLLYDERCPPGKWPLARIVEVHPGQDGLIRVVTLKCKEPHDDIRIASQAEEDDDEEGTSAVSRGTAIQLGDKPITSNGLANHHLKLSTY